MLQTRRGRGGKRWILNLQQQSQEAACHGLPLAEDAEPSNFRPCLFCNKLILAESRCSWFYSFKEHNHFLVVRGARDWETFNEDRICYVWVHISLSHCRSRFTSHIRGPSKVLLACDLSFIYNIILRSDGRRSRINTAELNVLSTDNQNLQQ